MFALLQLCSCLKPVILIPGTYASVLQFTGTNSDLQWYCPKTLNQAIVWVGEKYFIPPIINCVIQWVALHYDSVNNKQMSIPGMDVDVYGWGSVAGVTYLDHFIGNISFIPYFSDLAKVFRSHGYQDDITLFGAPHDWRFGISNQEVLWPRLKDLCEKVTQSTGEKAVLIGHSFGGFVCHHFAANIIPNYGSDWADKYLGQIIELSPSFGGAGSAVLYAYLRALKYEIEFKTELLEKTIESLGCIHTHFPNYELQKLHGDPPVVIGPDGTEYKASQLTQLLIDKGKVTGDNINLLHIMEPYLAAAPKKSTVKETIFYNSAIETCNGIKVDDWDNDKKVSQLNGRGDGTVLADNIEAYCNNIADKGLTKCIDMNDSSKNGKHFEMLFDKTKLESFYQASQE